ncbi:MAG: hypothetical protein KAR11_01030, partial [Phycisphaerae bacterium]|nr:hypothetical protein [Phycisphaerae bacterium]
FIYVTEYYNLSFIWLTGGLKPDHKTSGDGTSLHIASLLEPLGVKVTRLARGLPTGGQIEYANKTILSDAINERRNF